ncbi:hypothetical protein IG193_00445 [Infirmifilum lucidum]|uniref:Uncharacterized protein n=1 Tax=Infirmifilum lucidum TaxID=2776706 RepID=A0A7L9FGN9_9CREN|nr:hypothetical protein [Infirmifilum lucidum]QOJ78970.1 hypothetical protein IG193_00445 [Infirmifilum lucidum]
MERLRDEILRIIREIEEENLNPAVALMRTLRACRDLAHTFKDFAFTEAFMWFEFSSKLLDIIFEREFKRALLTRLEKSGLPLQVVESLRGEAYKFDTDEHFKDYIPDFGKISSDFTTFRNLEAIFKGEVSQSHLEVHGIIVDAAVDAREALKRIVIEFLRGADEVIKSGGAPRDLLAYLKDSTAKIHRMAYGWP